MFDLWPKICINFLIYANLEKLKRKSGINFLNYFVNKYHHCDKQEDNLINNWNAVPMTEGVISKSLKWILGRR